MSVTRKNHHKTVDRWFLPQLTVGNQLRAPSNQKKRATDRFLPRYAGLCQTVRDYKVGLECKLTEWYQVTARNRAHNSRSLQQDSAADSATCNSTGQQQQAAESHKPGRAPRAEQ